MNAKFTPQVKLVDVKNGQPMTTTLQIALGLGIQHASVIKIVRTYLPDIQEFGRVQFESTNSAFEMANSGFEIRNSNQGRHTRYAVLNEEQATFLMTLMRNSPRIIEFKKALVKSFFQAKALIQEDFLSLIKKREALASTFQSEKEQASADGSGLSRWRKRKEALQTAIADVDRQLQPCLPMFEE